MADTQVIRRKLIQVMAMLIYNSDVSRWFSGTISRSPGKRFCVPGLNCYSCPGAIASCPLGALQTSLATGRLPFFVTGFLMFTGVLLGRMVCAFLCPVGLIQELLYKIPGHKVKKTLRMLRFTRKFSIVKYVMLFIFCLAIPLVYFFRDGIGVPFFCKLICPAGTVGAGIPLVVFNENLRGSLGFLFNWKVMLVVIFTVWSVVMYRPFCRFICPLGAVYSFFNKHAIFGIKVNATKCTHCGDCTASCKMDVLAVNDRECIRCGECKKQCKFGAIT